MSFSKLDDYGFADGWGMTQFNSSLARNVSVVADQLIQAQLDMFLADTSRAVDITPPNLRTVPCILAPGQITGIPCERTYFMAGVEFTPRVLDNGTTDEQVILAKDQQGYILNYKEQPGDMEFDLETECEVYGFPFAAFNLCMRNAADNILHARK